MANPLDNNTHKGTLGELLVQLKLLTFNIESFPPLKDSGTDLVAYIGNCYKGIQIKTKQDGKNWSFPKEERIYDLLALVELDENLFLDKSPIWILTREEAEENKTSITNCKYEVLDQEFQLTQERVRELSDS